jgi:hypothetical protein
MNLMQSKDESRSLYNNGHYQDMLEVGMKFQDHVARTLYQYGIVVVGYTSRLYQAKHGENMLGAEIKRDGKFRETGNLYIELAEKSHPKKLYTFSPLSIYKNFPRVIALSRLRHHGVFCCLLPRPKNIV